MIAKKPMIAKRGGACLQCPLLNPPLSINNAKGPVGISAKFVKISADIIDCHIANIINKDISNNKFSENAKTTTVRPIF